MYIISPPCTAISTVGEKSDNPLMPIAAKDTLISLQAKKPRSSGSRKLAYSRYKNNFMTPIIHTLSFYCQKLCIGLSVHLKNIPKQTDTMRFFTTWATKYISVIFSSTLKIYPVILVESLLSLSLLLTNETSNTPASNFLDSDTVLSRTGEVEVTGDNSVPEGKYTCYIHFQKLIKRLFLVVLCLYIYVCGFVFVYVCVYVCLYVCASVSVCEMLEPCINQQCEHSMTGIIPILASMHTTNMQVQEPFYTRPF